MHYLVRMLVKAENAEQALENAISDAETLIEQETFDYFDTNGRWGKSEAYNLNSKEGQKQVDDAMQNAQADFTDAMKHIRHILDNYTDEEIFLESFNKDIQIPDDINFLSRWQFYRASGQDVGPYLYCVNPDVWGSKVDTPRELNSLLKGKDKSELWVVPIDFHS